MTSWTKMKSMHSMLFFIPDQLSERTVHIIVIGILCILLAFSLVALYRRIKCGFPEPFVEGMTANTDADTDTNSVCERSPCDVRQSEWCCFARDARSQG